MHYYTVITEAITVDGAKVNVPAVRPLYSRCCIGGLVAADLLQQKVAEAPVAVDHPFEARRREH